MASRNPGSHWLLVMSLVAAAARALNFTIAGGQIFTSGFAIVDAPQPGTPLGGDFLQVALDVTADGKLPLPGGLAPDSPSLIHNITIFLSSYDTKHNFTISNGTASADGAALGPVMQQEPGSTVKHVNWVWPDCLVGDGQPIVLNSARGTYNISIRQNFRLNNVDHYTVFDLPISVTNKIAGAPSGSSPRPACARLENPLLSPEQIAAAADDDAVGVLFAPGGATQVDVKGRGDSAATGTGLGPPKPTADKDNGLGSSAASSRRPPLSLVGVLGMCVGVVLMTT